MQRGCVIAGFIAGACLAFAQSPDQATAEKKPDTDTSTAKKAPAEQAPGRKEFEVASMKLNKSSDMRIMVRPAPGGRFIATNIPLRFLITLAYKLKEFQLSGAPDWLMSEHYDVEAKAEGNPKFDEMAPMLQALLEDRMQLKFHRETKEMPVYALVVAKAGKLHAAEGECGPRPNTPPPPPEPGKMPAAPCGGFFSFPGRMSGQKTSITQLVDMLSRMTNRIVVDKTGLDGKYDITLEWTPDQGQFPMLNGGPLPPGAPPLPQIDPNGPTLFTALQEQLGLKLDSEKGPVEMFVIDHVERPSEN